jgi:hypothetical protein
MQQNEFTADILAALYKLLPILNKRAVVFFTGGAGNPARYLKQVDDLLLTEAPIVISESFGQIAGHDFLKEIDARIAKDAASVKKAVREADLAVVPILTRNTLVKAALGIADTPVTCGLANALMQGKRVLAVRENYHPESAHTQKTGNAKNPAYNLMITQYETILQGFGAVFAESGDFSEALKRLLYPGVFGGEAPVKNEPQENRPGQVICEGSLITYTDVQAIPYGGSVAIAQNARLTALAEDYLKLRRIEVIRR